jgi:hypothetical protein
MYRVEWSYKVLFRPTINDPSSSCTRPNADRKGDGVRGGALTWISSFLFWNDFFGPKTEFKVADSRPGVNVMHVACDSNVCDKPNTIIVA